MAREGVLGVTHEAAHETRSITRAKFINIGNAPVSTCREAVNGKARAGRMIGPGIHVSFRH